MNIQVAISLLAVAISFLDAEYAAKAKDGVIDPNLINMKQMIGAVMSYLRGDTDCLNRIDLSLQKIKDSKDPKVK